MSTFQCIVYAIVHALGEFLPISASAHRALPALLFGWPEATGAVLGALYLGTLLALGGYFIHDWASMISCFLQVILFRKRPMTLDERLPMFLALTSLPVGLGWYYFHERLEQVGPSSYWMAAFLAAFTLPLWFSESVSRKNKGMFDWNWLDAVLVGAAELVTLVPGCGRTEGALWGAFSRNYSRESATKFSLFAAAPLMLAATVLNLKEVSFHAQPMPELSWLSFVAAVVVSFLTGLLAIGGLVKQVQRRGVAQYCGYRLILAFGIAALTWWRSRG